MSPQPDWGRGFVVSFVAASNDDGSLDFSSEAWKDGVAGAFSGMKAKGFFADEAGASGDVGARRFGFREGGGEKTNSGATGAAAAARPKIDGGFAGATGAPSSSGAVNANSSSSSSSSAGAGAGAGGENGDAGAGAGGAEKLNGLAAGAGDGAAAKLNGLAAAGAGDSAFGGASGDANGLAGAAPKG